MKKLIVLGAVVLATTFSLTSCGKKTETNTDVEPTEVAIDSVPQSEVDTTNTPGQADSVIVKE